MLQCIVSPLASVKRNNQLLLYYLLHLHLVWEAICTKLYLYFACIIMSENLFSLPHNYINCQKLSHQLTLSSALLIIGFYLFDCLSLTK